MAQRCDNCLNHVLGENALVVKMRLTRSQTKRPREALLQLDIGILPRMFSIGGSFGAREIPPLRCDISNLRPFYRSWRQYLVGSLTGAVASQNVTEAFTKVGLHRMEIGVDVQTQKPALLQGLPPEQLRK